MTSDVSPVSNIHPIEEKYERERLSRVLAEIETQLQKHRKEADRYKGFLRGAKADVWQELPHEARTFEELVELAGGLNQLKALAVQHGFALKRVKRLERLAQSPYFARVDFRQFGKTEPQKIYIGISSLTDEHTAEQLIYDWRAPVSSIYYDYEIGRVEFAAPAGTVTGEMLLKRHFRIKDGRILYMFDNSLTIFDEMLQEILSQASGDRMRSIVNTIQREQNRVIRAETRGTLLVQGAAGSGKTVIALHRAAYLLYKHRDTMTSKNILMLSPGKIFMDYTSPVLPELGEEPINEWTFGEWAAEKLLAERDGEKDQAGEVSGEDDLVERDSADKASNEGAPMGSASNEEASTKRTPGERARTGKAPSEEAPAGVTSSKGASTSAVIEYPSQVEDLSDQLEYLFSLRDTKGHKIRVAGIHMKSSLSFAHLLRRYAESIASNMPGPGDIVFRGKTVMSNGDALKLLHSDYSYLPLAQRVEKVKRRIEWLLEDIEANRTEELCERLMKSPETAHLFANEIRRIARQKAFEELEGIRNRVRLWRAMSPFQAYVRLFADEGLLRAMAQPSQESPGLEIPPALDDIRRDTLERLRSGVVPYEDVAPLLLLQGLLEGFPVSTGTRHVIVDEVQDYSPIQQEVLRHSFPDASFTLLGDVNQSFSVYSKDFRFEDLLGQVTCVYGAGGRAVVPVRLFESYRSTREITEFTKAILAEGEPVEAVERPGEPPVVTKCNDREELARAIAQDIVTLRDQGFESIAVICRTARESWAAYDDLKSVREEEGEKKQSQLTEQGERKGQKDHKDLKFYLVTARERRFRRGVLVIPSYLAKGLEFEAVIIYNAGNHNYSHPEDRRVLYTACTRALHRLHLYYTGEISPFVPQAKGRHAELG